MKSALLVLLFPVSIIGSNGQQVFDEIIEVPQSGNN